MTRWLTERESKAWRGLMGLTAYLDAELGRGLAQSGLSNADYAVLVSLTDAQEGHVRAQELASRLGWEKSRLSHQVNRMCKRGLIVRRECSTDRRGTFVEITAEGRAAIERAAPHHVDAVRELLIDRLSGEQLDTLAEIATLTLPATAHDVPCDES